jgi:hypothetical protein
MRTWIRELDGILRGNATRLTELREGTIQVSIGGLSLLLIILGVIYGACMGFFAIFREGEASLAQFFAGMIKVPMLFFLTLLVTFPSLYVFNALVGSRLTVSAVLRLLIAAMAVNLAVLASLGPIVAFFSASTTSYSFMVLLNVAVFAVAGVLGLIFLLQTLHRLTVANREREAAADAARQPPTPEAPPPVIAGPSNESALDALEGRSLGRHEKAVFRCWVVVFALVGSQMGWVLRPFIGHPDLPFSFFRERGSNFFQAVGEHLLNLVR